MSFTPTEGPTQTGGGNLTGNFIRDLSRYYVPKFFYLMRTILDFICENPICAFMLACGFVSIGIAVFGKLKRVAR